MDTSGEKEGISFRFSVSLTLVNNMFQVSILGNVLGEAKSFSKRSSQCSVVGWAVVVGNHLGWGSNRVGGDRGTDYGGSNMGRDHWGFVDNGGVSTNDGCVVDSRYNRRFVDCGDNWSVVDVR
jgi:hypothetical protein